MRTIEQAAAAMGMKPVKEVREVLSVDVGDLVLTHDGQWTLLYTDGSTAPADMAMVVRYQSAPAAGGVVEPGVPIVADDGGPPELVVPDLPPAAQIEADPVPDGSVATIAAWFVGNPDRATRARDAELAKDEPRKTLLTEAQKVIDANGS
jgi:hypothetical protein